MAASGAGPVRRAHDQEPAMQFEVIGIRGHAADDKVAHFQVTLKVGLRPEA
jgi:flavin-binding protein dodecin